MTEAPVTPGKQPGESEEPLGDDTPAPEADLSGAPLPEDGSDDSENSDSSDQGDDAAPQAETPEDGAR